VYDRRIEDKILTLGVSGKLYLNALVMYDHQTDSLWSHVLGQAIRGNMKGKQLRFIPGLQTTWGKWKKIHPDTLTLSKKKSPYGKYDFDHYQSYYGSAKAGLIGPRDPDYRIAPKELILGIMIKGRTKAYPFSVLKENTVINDELGENKILIVFDPVSRTGAIFEREVSGKTLIFTTETSKSNGLSVITDLETNTTWSPLAGQGLKGKLKGKSLKQLPSTYAFWFAWRDYFPYTEIFQPSSSRK
jgi:hypothetical protein